MAQMSTLVKEFADKGNIREYTYTGHTAQKPKMVLQSRVVATGGQKILEDKVSVLSGTEDAEGLPLATRVLFTATIRRPVDGVSADVTAALAVFRDIIAGDEFANTVSTQEWLS
jgi:hypothetical protein